MKSLGEILQPVAPGAQNTGWTSPLDRILSSDLGKGARGRIEERKSRVVAPRWDVEIGDWVSTCCLKCGDTGWVVLDVESTHPDFGKSFECECGVRFDKTASLMRHSGIPVSKGKSFSNFREVKGTKNAVAAAKEFSSGGLFMLLIYGISGCGKTHLAQAVGRELIEKGQVVRFIMAPAMLLDLKAGFTDEFDFARRMEEYIKAPILIIDDLSWRTEFDIETLNDLLIQRESADVRTMVTTNRKYVDLQDNLPRVLRRFSDPLVGRVVANEAGNYNRRA